MKYVKIEGGVKLSTYITPMLATLSDDPIFDHPDWVFEVKWDGYRAVAELGGSDTRFYSRNGLLFNKAYPKVYEALKTIKEKAVLDGEVVVIDKSGLPSFQALQNYKSTQNLPIQFYVFDCLLLKGKDLTKLPLLERKKILQDFLPQDNVIRYCDHVEEQGKALFEHAKKSGLEGIIAKHARSKYTPGKRTKEWLKIKNVLTDDFVIVGYTDPGGSRQYFGSLFLAWKKNGKLTFAGGVGTGFTERLLKELYTKLRPIGRERPPVELPIRETKDMHWVEPVYVCQIKYAEITEEGLVRHPSFLGLRIDK
jgi:bifunctional non-homologous end joining protein LigD